MKIKSFLEKAFNAGVAIVSYFVTHPKSRAEVIAIATAIAVIVKKSFV